MHRLWFCALLLVTAAATAQVPAQEPVEQAGYAPVIAYGAVVPEIATVNISNSPVGATNATGNNLAGARNSTIGNVPGLSYASISAPVYVQPFPTTAPAREPEMAAAERVPGVIGAVQIPSAYSVMRDPLAVAARTRFGTQQRTSARIYTNTDLQHMAQEFERTGSATVSTVRRRINTDTSAAQSAHDRNLGVH